MKSENNPSIPNIKYTTKEELKAALDQKEKEVQDLKERFYQLDYAKDQLQEKLFAAGVDERPTIMSRIINREEETKNSIIYIVSSCEKETGRSFPWEILFI